MNDHMNGKVHFNVDSTKFYISALDNLIVMKLKFADY